MSYRHYDYDDAPRRSSIPWGKIVGIIVLAVLVVGLISIALSGYYTDLAFRQKVGDYFERADSASTAHTKMILFDQYVQAMRDNGLTTGQTNLWQQSPRSSLESIYNITLSLQQALHNLDQTCAINGTISFACSNGLKEISITEFCWYPIDPVHAGWDIQHGWGILHLFNTDQSNRCASSTSTGG